MVYHDPIASLPDLRESVEHHVCNIPQFMLPTIVKYEVLRFQMIADNGEHHIVHVLSTFVYYLYVLNKGINAT